MPDQRDRELAAILAGLRLLQQAIIPKWYPLIVAYDDINAIATNMDSFQMLDGAEIDSLCQQLNTEWDLLHADVDTCQQNVKELTQ